MVRAANSAGKPRNLQAPVVHMMYTISRGPSKLVTQRRTGDNTDPFDSLMVSQQHDATSQPSRAHDKVPAMLD